VHLCAPPCKVDERVGRYAIPFSVVLCVAAVVVGYTNFVFFSHSVEYVKVGCRPSQIECDLNNLMTNTGRCLSKTLSQVIHAAPTRRIIDTSLPSIP
jgi:hypothetical protein